MPHRGLCRIPPRAPPLDILRRVDSAVPGIWPAVTGAFNRSLAGLSGQLASWYRDPGTNAACGGSPTSQHLAGLAFDLVPRLPSVAAVRLRGAGFVVIDEGDHLHAQVFPASVQATRRLLI